MEDSDDLNDSIFNMSLIQSLLEEIDILKNAQNARDKAEQDNFNTKFIIKLMIFVTFYRFYSMHIDPQEHLVNTLEKFITDISDSIPCPHPCPHPRPHISIRRPCPAEDVD